MPFALQMKEGKRAPLSIDLGPADVPEASGSIERPRRGVLLVHVDTEHIELAGDVDQQGGSHSASLPPGIHEQHVDVSVVLREETERILSLVEGNAEIGHLGEVPCHDLFVPIDVGRSQKAVTLLDGSTPDHQ